VLTVSALACGGSRGLLSPSDGSGGSTGRSSTANPVIGSWETTIVIFTETDMQAWTTRWRFDQATGTPAPCLYRQTVASVLEGVTTEKVRTCTWEAANARLTIRFDDTGAVFESQYRFPGGDTSRLIFEGIEYHRIDQEP